MCGRVTGVALGSPESFRPNNRGDATINDSYVDGLSVTHGTPRQHIWTFVADSTSQPIGSVPFFVGQDYFCDSDEMHGWKHLGWNGLPNILFLYFELPPWFNTRLPSATTDHIEVRICFDEDINNENVSIQLLEMYIQ